jgi:hypothetical protein
MRKTMLTIRIRRVLYLAVLTAALHLHPSESSAQQRLINFDDIANGTSISTLFAGAGVTFSNPLGGNIYARGAYGFAPSGPNVVSVFESGLPQFNAYYGAVDVTFSTPQSFVSIDARPMATLTEEGQNNNRPFLEAYSGQTFLGKILYSRPLPNTGVGVTETLTYWSPTANITRVRFSVQQGNGQRITGLFDNLRIGVPAAPEYTVSPKHSGKCLDVAWFTTLDAGDVVQSVCSSTDNQTWQIARSADGVSAIFTAKHSGKALDVLGQSMAHAADVVQWTNGGFQGPGVRTSQWWRPVFVKVENNIPYYKLVNTNSGMCLDVAWFSQADGGNVLQATCTGTDNQLWDIVNIATGVHGY